MTVPGTTGPALRGDDPVEALEPGVPFLSSIGFSITARCPIACPHCIVEARPGRREEMSLADGTAWLGEVGAYRGGRIRSVIFTGGEPFYPRRLLAGLVETAHAHGLFSAVVTNAFWARTVNEAKEVLRSFPGIGMLTVSTDAFHQRAIPLSFAINALRGGQELGLACSAAVCFRDPADPSYLATLRALEAVVGAERVRPSITYPAGRARQTIAPDLMATTADPPDAACTAADFPTIFPDGTVIGCMGIVGGLPDGHPLRLGDARAWTLGALLDLAETNLVLQALRVWGPGRLVRMLADAGLGDALPARWVRGGSCDLCYALTTDRRLLDGLRELAARPEFGRTTAYARLHYLGEGETLERLWPALAQGVET